MIRMPLEYCIFQLQRSHVKRCIHFSGSNSLTHQAHQRYYFFCYNFFSSKLLPYFLHSMKNNESISQWFNALYSLFGSLKWIDSFDVTDNFQKMISCICGRLSSTYDFQAKMIRIRLLAMQAYSCKKGLLCCTEKKRKSLN